MAAMTKTFTITPEKIEQACSLLASSPADPVVTAEGEYVIKIARSELQRMAAAPAGTTLTVKLDATSPRDAGSKSNTGLLVGLAVAAAALYFVSQRSSSPSE